MIATIELNAAKGNHGIILMNSISNTQKYGGPKSAYRALFLEKSDKWQIKGGLQWSDASFSKAIATAKKLKLTGLPGKNNEIDWANRTVSTNDMYSLQWKAGGENKTQNIYQQLIMQMDDKTPTNSLDFWNGKEEPIEDNSNVSNVSALFVDGRWRATNNVCCKESKSNIKAWFNLFKGDKGTW